MRSNGSEIEVMLDIFSGRPNPKWMLSEEQVDELKVKVDKLPMSKPIIPPRLGYHGFVVTNLSKDQRLPDQIKVYNSVITIVHEGKTSCYEDGNNVEEWLIKQTHEHGYGEIIEQFRQYSSK